MSINRHFFGGTIRTSNNGHTKAINNQSLNAKNREDIVRQTALFISGGGRIEVLPGIEFGAVSSRSAHAPDRVY